MQLAQLGGGGLQFGLGAIAAPEGFEREFQLALRPHARKAQRVCEHGTTERGGERHGDFLLLKWSNAMKAPMVARSRLLFKRKF
ncbi:hypothetical protein D3C86_1905200 [compost metagenome]